MSFTHGLMSNHHFYSSVNPVMVKPSKQTEGLISDELIALIRILNIPKNNEYHSD